MKSSQSLDGHDPASAHSLRRHQQGLVTGRKGLPGLTPEFQMRAAIRTSVRLGVKPPVHRVLVLGPAGIAHPEPTHRRGGSVVGQRLNDRVSGAAVGAVGKRILIAPVVAVEYLPAAFTASGDVRQNERRLAAFIHTVADLKFSVSNRIEEGGLKALND